jgi:phosphogluconate dehydratase
MTIEATVNARVAEVTKRIARRSSDKRARYLDRIAEAAATPHRQRLGCANQAHAFAACAPRDKTMMREGRVPSLAIVTAYNDMLSAPSALRAFSRTDPPERARSRCRRPGGRRRSGHVRRHHPGRSGHGVVAVFARRDRIVGRGGAVASDLRRRGVSRHLRQDRAGPRDRRALFRAFAGGLHSVGPDDSGLANDAKSKIRQAYAEGKVGREALLEAEAKAYHGPGTCTFYGTANTNQMLMEIMGLHLPGASFVNPNTPLRDALTRAATERALAMTSLGNDYTPLGQMLDERAFVNGIVGLHATGGSTNHTLHLVAMAAAAGLTLNWNDFADLAEVTPLLSRIYPNGSADVNHFHAAGGMGLLMRELVGAGLLHGDVSTVCGP